jgi:hypothetical protein
MNADFWAATFGPQNHRHMSGSVILRHEFECKNLSEKWAKKADRLSGLKATQPVLGRERDFNIYYYGSSFFVPNFKFFFDE